MLAPVLPPSVGLVPAEGELGAPGAAALGLGAPEVSLAPVVEIRPGIVVPDSEVGTLPGTAAVPVVPDWAFAPAAAAAQTVREIAREITPLFIPTPDQCAYSKANG